GRRRKRARGVFLSGRAGGRPEKRCEESEQDGLERLQAHEICGDALHIDLDAGSRRLRRLTPESQCNAMAAGPGGDLEEPAEALVNSNCNIVSEGMGARRYV